MIYDKHEDRPGGGVEVLGPWLHNKGDDLMMRAVNARLGSRYALAVSSALGLERLPDDLPLYRIWRAAAPGEKGAALRKASLRRWLRAVRKDAVPRIAGRAALRKRGFVHETEIRACLDCSGFAYGDQWSTHRPRARAAYYAALKERGVRLVMLPQAMGPFQKEDVREAMRELLRPFDLVFARDARSASHLAELELDPRVVRTVPDITHLLPGHPPPASEGWARRVCVVPNARMIDKTDAETGACYVSFLAFCIEELDRLGLEPCLVLHETNDADLARRVVAEARVAAPVFDEPALVSKGYLGACRAVVGSRYHALVSSLSQGVPTVGTAWTHKYNALFEEYGCTDHLISPRVERGQLAALLAKFAEPSCRETMSRQLSTVAAAQRRKVEGMWEAVEATIDGRGPMPERTAESGTLLPAGSGAGLSRELQP